MKTKKQIISEHYREMGKSGGEARAAKLSSEERSRVARLGGLARQKKLRDSKKSS